MYHSDEFRFEDTSFAHLQEIIKENILSQKHEIDEFEPKEEAELDAIEKAENI